MKQTLLTIVFMLLPMLASADAVEINGIYYNLSGTTAEVTKNPNEYQGNVTIPVTVDYNGTTYSVASIGSSAFWGCSGLTSITIPNSVTSIGVGAFWGCSGLTSISIPNSVTSIEKQNFSNCSGLKSIYVDEANANYKSTDGVLYTKTGKALIAYPAGKAGTTYTIPNSVTWIKPYTFYGCSGLTSITIPNSVTTIGLDAFCRCSSLTSVTIPSSVTSIEYDAFKYCSGLTSIKVEEGNTKYDSRNNCNAIIETKSNKLMYGCKTTTIPNSVTTIGGDAFMGCTGLTSITIPNSVTIIQGYAFASCSGLTSINIPNSVTSIENYAFGYCSSLTSITIPSSVTSIQNWAFEKCSSLTSVHISDLDSWCKIAFGNYSSNPVYYAHHLFLNGTEIKDLVIPNSVTSIGGHAFYNCSGLTSTTIPNSVTRIGDNAFSGCSGLTSITIGNSVTNIGKYAFYGCSGLLDVFCHAENVPTTDSFIFTNNANATLHVPAEAVSAYKSDAHWSGFKEIKAIGASSADDVLSCEDIECAVGSKSVLNVTLKNEDEVKLCQFDLSLPAGVTVAKKSNGKLDAKLTERAETHSISSKQLSNGNYRFIISSMDNDSFTGNSGTLVEITLDIPATMEAGEYTVKLLNAELSVPDGTDLKVVKPADTESKLTIKAYTPGDVNNDGSVSVTDVGCAINYILEQVPSVFIFEAADMNGDKSISVTDVGMIINLILNEGSAASPKLNRAAAVNAQLTQQRTTEGYQLQLENKDAFIGFQMDLQIANEATINDMKLMGGDDHLMTCRQLDNGLWRVICYSPTNNTFVASDPALLNIATDGNVTISSVRLTTADLREVCLDAVSGGTTGITDVKGLQSEELKVYSLDGRLCRTIRVQQGENPLQGLKPGVYMIGNRKVVVR